jgi:hypothetical protein
MVFALTSHAQIPHLKLTWEAPAGCPSRSEVERSVDRLLGNRAPDDRTIDAHVVVTLRPNGVWISELVMSGPATGKRQLEGESCSAIALATAVVLAFAIDPHAAPALPEEPRERAAPAPAPAPTPAVPDQSLKPFVHAFGGAALSTLPAVAGELGVGVGLRYGPWETELMAAYAPSRSVQVAGPLHAGADINRLSATALGCFAPIAVPAAALDLCVGAALERMAAQATGVSNPGSGSVLLFSPTLGVRSRTRLAPRLALVLDLEATIRTFHPRFVIDGVGQVYDIPVVGGSFGGGLALGF